MERVALCFARRETRMTCRDMVRGLLTQLGGRNCWALAEAARPPRPHRMQHLLSCARVNDQQVLDFAVGWAAGHLSAGQAGDDTVLIVDETDDAKSSADCAGAARQYSGTLDRIDLCQVVVTLAHALIGRALHLPADWAADEERRKLAGVPHRTTKDHRKASGGSC